MKKLFLIPFISLLFFGCTMNPNKEARIQKLESNFAETMKKIDELEARVQSLESINEQLESRILELEK